MAFDFSTLFWIFLAIMVLQPLFTGRWYALRRAQAIRAIERLHGSRVITMIHREEKRSIFGFAVSRHIDLEGAQTVIAAIKDTPDDMPIDLVLHTPGGLVNRAPRKAGPCNARRDRFRSLDSCGSRNTGREIRRMGPRFRAGAPGCDLRDR